MSHVMSLMKKMLSLSLGFVVLATIVVLVTGGTVGAQVPSVPVRVTNTPSVNVNSTPTTPVYVDADRPARSGFNASCFTGDVDPDFGQAQCSLLTIPAGRQVVIESISCQASLVAGEGPGDAQLVLPNTPFGGGATQNVSHLLALSKQAGDATFDIWRMTTPLRAYASAPDGGSVGIFVFFRANHSPAVPQGLFCAVSGYPVGQ
jgi:hypothetical protein